MSPGASSSAARMARAIASDEKAPPIPAARWLTMMAQDGIVPTPPLLVEMLIGAGTASDAQAALAAADRFFLDLSKGTRGPAKLVLVASMLLRRGRREAARVVYEYCQAKAYAAPFTPEHLKALGVGAA